jgi:predicted XRE-type DNA-binding protein
MNDLLQLIQLKNSGITFLQTTQLSQFEIAILMHTTESNVKEYSSILCKQFNVKNRYLLTQACFAVGIVKQAVYYDSTMGD